MTDLSNLHEFLSDGTIFTAIFVKRSTGEIREMNCRMGVKKHLKGGNKAYDEKEKGLLFVYDLKNEAYRSIPIENLLVLRAHGREIFKRADADEILAAKAA